MAHVVLITGVSGSGKTTALRALEDIGFVAMDNLPVVLLPDVVALGRVSGQSGRIAVVVDVRAPHGVANAGSVVDALRERDIPVDILFLDALTERLLTRFQATRRRHPLDAGGDLRDALARERDALDELLQRATLTLDTSTMNVHELKRRIQDRYRSGSDQRLRVTVQSFGFKHGPLTEADLVFDVRFLPNPHFEPDLRPWSGLSPTVSSWVLAHDDAGAFLERVTRLLEWLLPRYEDEGKAYLTVGIGCTGGKHRSVALSEAIGGALRDAGFRVAVDHRDREHWKPHDRRS